MQNESSISAKFSPSKKLGVKYLDDSQLTNCFPDWQALLQRIEEQRQIAENTQKKAIFDGDGRFPQMYDNLYAILGGRGAGKSSVVLTLRNRMMVPLHQDILLPIITPEIISERECSILGWIMSATESVIVELETRIQCILSHRMNSCKKEAHCFDDFFKNCQFQKDNPLRKSYQDLFKKSILTTGGLDISGYSTEDAVGYRVEQSRKQYKLMHDLNRFWNELTDYWYKVNLMNSQLELREANSLCAQLNESPIKHPLIILIFDDIDLVPERSMELLTTTFQYFTNSNIVIILTAAEKVLKDVIRLKMLERMVGSESNSLLLDYFPEITGEEKNLGPQALSSKLDSVQKMANEFYDKVIPPSSRYQLHRYQTISEKKLYSYSSMNQSFQAPLKDVSTYIETYLVEQVDELVAAFSGKGGATTNFLLGGYNGKTFREAYLAIFGDKSRNIANGCLEIMNTFTRLEALSKKINGLTLNWEERKELLQSLRHLMQALMFSKPELNEFVAVVNALVYVSSDRQRIVVNFEEALNYYYKERQEIRDWIAEHMDADGQLKFSTNHLNRIEKERVEMVQKKYAALITLLFFVEGVLLTVNASSKQLHGYPQLNRLLNEDVFGLGTQKTRKNQSSSLFPQRQDVENFLDYFPLMLEHIDRYVDIDPYRLSFARDYLEDSFRARAGLDRPALQKFLLSQLKTNREWVKTIMTMLAIRYSGITLVESGILSFSSDFRRKLEFFAFTSTFNSNRESAAQLLFAQNNLELWSRQAMQTFREVVFKEHNWLEIVPGIKAAFADMKYPSPLQAWSDCYERSRERLANYIPAYTAHRWQDFLKIEYGNEDEEEPDGTVVQGHSELSYALIRFIDKCLATVLDIICKQTCIFLTATQFEEIFSCLRRIYDNNKKLQLKKNNLNAVLKRARSQPTIKGLEFDADLDGQTRLNDGHEPVWSVPSGAFIEYMLELQCAIEIQESGDNNAFSYFDPPDLSGYFALLKYLAVALEKPDDSIKLGGKMIPLSAAVILDLKMLEDLLPVYFAAKMDNALENQGQTDLSSPGEMESLEEKLRTLFESLTQKKSGAPNRLKDLMREAQNELAKNYFNYLEGGDE